MAPAPASPAPETRGWRSRLWIAAALLSGAGFVASPEAGLGAGVAALGAVFLFSPRRERDVGLLLGVLGLGILLSARSLYPALGILLASAYLLARDRWPPALPGRGPLGNRTLYELVTALGAVALVVVLLQQGTATWPAMVAVESCSMEPNVRVGDLVVVVGPTRSSITTQGGDLVQVPRGGRGLPAGARQDPPTGTGPGPSSGPGQSPSAGSGPGPSSGTAGSLSGSGQASSSGAGGPQAEASGRGLVVDVVRGGGAGERSFALTSGCTAERPDGGGCAARGEPVAGDVIVFYPNGNPACTPIIHRARAWVADNGTYEGRTFARGGFITKGDNNGPRPGQPPAQAADQMARGGTSVCPNTEPVRPEWMVGVAKFRVPWLGYVRLLLNPSNWPKSCAAGL